jgi:hypothetical protein
MEATETHWRGVGVREIIQPDRAPGTARYCGLLDVFVVIQNAQRKENKQLSQGG